MSILDSMGWSHSFQLAFESIRQDGWEPARVVEQHRGGYWVWAENGESSVTLAGRFRHHAPEYPAVGDWVAVQSDVIQALLPRRTVLVRAAAGKTSAMQVLAANVDVVFVMTSLNNDFNPRRLERALAIAWESGARPVVLLTKLDLCSDPTPYLERVPPGVPMHCVSSLTGKGVDLVREHLLPGITVTLLGSSGVGKSSLVNRLLGAEVQAVRAIREDDRGRHATTHRELFRVGHALMIDTPGIREVGIGNASVDDVFEEVTQFAATCRFRDCRHDAEPGCAVKTAMDPEKLRAYRKLERERSRHERRHDEKRRTVRIHREMRRLEYDSES